MSWARGTVEVHSGNGHRISPVLETFSLPRSAGGIKAEAEGLFPLAELVGAASFAVSFPCLAPVAEHSTAVCDKGNGAASQFEKRKRS